MKRYTVRCEGFPVWKKRLIQEGFFKLGSNWIASGRGVVHLHASEYTNEIDYPYLTYETFYNNNKSKILFKDFMVESGMFTEEQSEVLDKLGEEVTYEEALKAVEANKESYLNPDDSRSLTLKNKTWAALLYFFGAAKGGNDLIDYCSLLSFLDVCHEDLDEFDGNILDYESVQEGWERLVFKDYYKHLDRQEKVKQDLQQEIEELQQQLEAKQKQLEEL